METSSIFSHPLPESIPHGRSVSRKRTLGRPGVGLLVAAPLLSSVGVVEASQLFQHRVRTAQRHVPYPHVLEGRPRDQPKFRVPSWHKDDHSYSIHSEEARKLAHLELVNDDPDHMFWSLVADASQLKSTTAQAEQTQPQREDERSLRQSQRRTQITDKFVEDSTSAVLVEKAGVGEEQEYGFIPPDLHKNYEGYNVTAEVVYNVSEPENENLNTTEETTSSVLTSSYKLPDNGTSQSSSSNIYQPLRLRAVLSQQQNGGQFLTEKGREILLHDIVRPALLTWSAALRVEPVSGNLTVDEHQLFDDKTCGPGTDSGMPSPTVPSYHLNLGVPDTDTILYLSIGFAPGAFDNWRGYMNYTTANKTENQQVDPNNGLTWNAGEQYYVHPKEKDVDSEDTADGYFRWGEHTQSPTEMPSPGSQPWMCSGNFVAAASYCSTDQFDRPTAGMLHICIDGDFFSENTRNRQIVTIMHEVGHVLGFNAKSMAHFRKPDGSPITPRVGGEIVETLVECTGPSLSRRFANVILPSEEILQFRTVRGGVRVAEVVSESVRLVARNHFDCHTLTGAELESLSGDEGEDECIGDHWEKRLFRNDLMNPVVDDVDYQPYISTITLAYFADSGWYQVDLSMAELAASWGRAAGCGFVEDTCIGADGTVSPSNKPFFCTAAPTRNAKGLVQEIDGCTPDLNRKAACSLGKYDSEIPPEYQYFVSLYDGTVGGSDPFADYCPTFSGFENGLCSNNDAALLKVNNIERFGKRNSRCLSGVVDSRATALCLPIACVVEDRTLHVKIDGTWRLCSRKDQELKVKADQFVVCPDPRRVCPTFYCHHDCLGTNGRCDYDTGACVCDGGLNELAPGENKTVNNRACKQDQYEEGNKTLKDMPHADTSMADYYVPSKKDLQNDQNQLLTPLQFSVLVTFAIIIAIAAYFFFRLQGEDEAGEGDDPDGPPDQHNANKDKMIATVLVDMRMNEPDAASVARTLETSGSVFDIDSTASSSLQPMSSLDQDDRSSLASEEVLDSGDPLRANSNSECSVRQRRCQGRSLH